SHRTSPAERLTSRLSPLSATRRRSNEESVYIRLSGCSCGRVASPGSSRYSKTRTRSFSKITLYLSGSVLVGSAMPPPLAPSRTPNLQRSYWEGSCSPTIFVVLRCALDRRYPALAPLHPDLGL